MNKVIPLQEQKILARDTCSKCIYSYGTNEDIMGFLSIFYKRNISDTATLGHDGTLYTNDEYKQRFGKLREIVEGVFLDKNTLFIEGITWKLSNNLGSSSVCEKAGIAGTPAPSSQNPA